MYAAWENIHSLDLVGRLWDRLFTVAPLVLIGTKEPNGEYDLAPKHMAGPMGQEDYFGFVCTPKHSTYHNAKREAVFTVSYPKPTQILLASIAAAPRCEDGSKPSLQALPVFKARTVDSVFVQDAYFFLECQVHRVYDDFGTYSLITGKVVAAHVERQLLRGPDRDGQDILQKSPLLAYISPGRFASVDETQSFPFHEGTQR